MNDLRTPCGRWVDEAQGVVSRDAFVSDDVYRLELDRIFQRSWVFLAHESEFPEPGDYVARTLGRAPVLVVRGNDRSVIAMLNSCRHRGAKALPLRCRVHEPFRLPVSWVDL